MVDAFKGTAMVTGASAGIGKVYADRLAARGYELILVARRLDRLDALAAELARRHGARTSVEVADLTNETDLTRLEGLLRNRKDIELLVNNAGAGVLGKTADSQLHRQLQTIQLNVVAMTRLSLAALQSYRVRNRGGLIVVGSSAALAAQEQSAVYSGTKAYNMNFTRSLQLEYAGTPIRIQLTLPGAVHTEFVEAAGLDSSLWDTFDCLTAEQHVDAALAGFDRGEMVTAPSLLDESLWNAYDGARAKAFEAMQVGEVARRYL
jgi:uncharacterized protein